MAKLFDWFDTHPFKSIVGYTILVAGSVFAFSKFILIENTEMAHKSELAIKDATIAQYEARVQYLEKENTQLTEEANRYLSWLQNTPGTLEYLQKENSDLRAQIEDEANESEKAEVSQNATYTRSYDFVKENTSVIDDHTGLVVTLTNINTYYEGDLSIWEQDNGLEHIEKITAGYTRKYTVAGIDYRITISMIDWISRSYSVSIRQLP